MCSSKYFSLLFFIFFIGIFSFTTAHKSAKNIKCPASLHIDSIAVHKSERKMLVFNNSKLIKTYHISLGSNSIGPKQFQGDGKTPEGLYYIDGKNPISDYHKNLGISYPTDAEAAWAKEFKRSAGGDIKIHGFPNGYTFFQRFHLPRDWTAGCIAVSDKEIDELFNSVEIGVPILITP